MGARAIKNSSLNLIWQIPNLSFPTPFSKTSWLITSSMLADSVNSASYHLRLLGYPITQLSDFTGVLLGLFSWLFSQPGDWWISDLSTS